MNLLRNLFEGRPQAVQEALAWWNAAGGPSVPAVVAQTLHRCGDTPGGSRLAEQALHVASNVAASARVTRPWRSFVAVMLPRCTGHRSANSLLVLLYERLGPSISENILTAV